MFFKNSLFSVTEEFNDSNSVFTSFIKKRADFTDLQNSVISKKFKKELIVITLKKFKQKLVLLTLRKLKQESVLLILRKLKRDFMILIMFFNENIMLKNDLKSINILNDSKFFIKLNLTAAIRV